MKILIGSVSYDPNISGVAVSTYLLAHFLALSGHKVWVLAPASRFKTYTEPPEIQNLKVIRLRAIANPFRQGFYIPVGVRGQVKKIVRGIRPDIVHLQDPMPTSVIIQRQAAALAVPVVATNHFLLDYVLSYLPKFTHKFAGYYLRQKLAAFYNRCQAVTCPTQTVATMLKLSGVSSPIVALSNGVDLHRFYSFAAPGAIRSWFGLPDKPIVLYLGRVDKDKSIDVLLKSIPMISDKVDCHFVIAGGGSMKDYFSGKVSSNKLLNDRVTLTGPIPHQSGKLVGLYQLAQIFVIPSTIETQSIATLEAMAAGKPIVAAAAGALPELVKHNVNGFLFAPGDAPALAKHVIALVQNIKLREAMGVKSLEFVAKHELKKSLRLFEQLYKKCVQDHQKKLA